MQMLHLFLFFEMLRIIDDKSLEKKEIDYFVWRIRRRIMAERREREGCKNMGDKWTVNIFLRA